jgi:2-methylcitrate dehydratase PrpD
MTVERRLAEHVARLCYNDLSDAARDATDRLFLDTLAAMLSGVGNGECRGIVGKLVGDEQGGHCTVAGRAEGVSAAMAALANGIFAHWCEWDDVHDAAGIHGSAVIFPVLLAAAEESGLGPDVGREFVTAVVAAYDVAARIGLVMNAHSFHGWMTTGAAATIGAAGAAARLMGLDQAGILSAMGIAATGGGLSRQSLADRTSGKNALCGMAARNAMDAAWMAAAGITGAPNFFAGVYGISALHAGGKADIAPLLDDFGERFLITDAGVKAYPSCRSTHPSIDLMLDFLAERPDIGALVEKVAFTVPDLPFALCGRSFMPGDNPRVSAQFSIPFTAALALTRGAVAPRDFLPEKVLAFAIEQSTLIRAITVEAANPPIGAQKTVPARTRVTLRTGEVLDRVTDSIKGSVHRPMTPQDEWCKLAVASAGVLTEAQCEQLRTAGRDLRRLGPAPALEILRGA